MIQRGSFVNKHCLFLLFIIIICMIGYEYIEGIELEGIFKILFGDKLEGKFHKKILYILPLSFFPSFCSIINDYKKQMH